MSLLTVNLQAAGRFELYSKSKVLISEKVLSILSYMTFGIVGFIWLLIANWKNKKIRYFLNYHIYQSIFIAVLLTLLYYVFEFVFAIFSKIPFLEMVAAVLNYVFTVKIISFLGFQSTLVYLTILFLKIYLIVGVILGKCFYIPFVTKTINYITEKNYY